MPTAPHQQDPNDILERLLEDSRQPPIGVRICPPAKPKGILYPMDIEYICRQVIDDRLMGGSLLIRFAIRASTEHLNSWFAGRHIIQGMVPSMPDNRLDSIFSSLRTLDLLDSRKAKRSGRYRDEFRLNSHLAATTHFHGKRALLLMNQLEAYYHAHPRMGPIPALALTGMTHYGLRTEASLLEFMRPDFGAEEDQSIVGRILQQLAALKIMHREGSAAVGSAEL